MTEQTPLENSISRVVLLAEAQGISIDDLIEMLSSGASVRDIVVALNPHGMDA